MGSIRLAGFAAALALAAPAVPLDAAEEAQPWMKPDRAAVQRWQEMRFGMFIHWGPVSLTGREIGWSRGAPTPIEEYDRLYLRFDPTRFNADEWAAIARDAGMKYVVLTTKHHDGFCLWDTKESDYNIMRSPFGRDVVKELSAAYRRAGIAFGTYYSVCDWHHPDFPLTSPGGKVARERSDLDAYNRYLLAQIRELVTNYGPLVTLWNDVPQAFRGRGVETIRLARGLQPDILINNRTGDGGDFDTPEQRVGSYQDQRPWESCMTLSAHNHWAWGGANDGVKPLSACLQMLVRCAGGDGNMLLNVGPTPEGEIAPDQRDRLKEMGAWLGRFGESVYGTRGGPFKPAKHVVSTRKGNTVYLHVLAWPEDVLSLPPLPAKVVGSRVLTGGTAAVRQTDAGIEVAVPPADRDAADTIIALELDQPALSLKPIPVASIGQPLTEGKKVTASNVYQGDPHYAPAMAVDGDEGTRWATDAGTKECWLEVDLGKPETFDRVAASEYEPRVRSFELRVKEGDAWRTFYRGEAMGREFEARFPPVTARHVRLNIMDASNGPTMYEFRLFAPRAAEGPPPQATPAPGR